MEFKDKDAKAIRSTDESRIIKYVRYSCSAIVTLRLPSLIFSPQA